MQKLLLSGQRSSVVLAVVAVLAFVWLSYVLATNPLAVHGLPFFEQYRPAAHYYSHENYDINSVMLTRSPVIYSILEKDDPANGLSFRPHGFRDVPPDVAREHDVAQARAETAELSVYLSSFHLQGYIWSALAKMLSLSVDDFEPALRLVGSLLTALVLTSILVWYWREFTPLAFIAGLIMVPMTVGIVLAAPNIFRVPWITVLPFAVSLWTYRWHPLLHFGAIATTLLTSFLCSLEFASNSAAAIAVPAVYFGLLAGQSYVRIFGHMIKYAAFAIVVFAAAMTLTALRVDSLTGGDPSGFELLLSRAENWTVNGILQQQDPEVGLVDGAIKIAGATGLTLYGALALPNIAVLIGGLVLVFMGIARGAKWQDGTMNDTRAWSLTTLYALAASISWIVLQFHHVAFHPRFSPFLVFYPFVLCFTGLVGLMVRDWLCENEKGEARRSLRAPSHDRSAASTTQ